LGRNFEGISDAKVFDGSCYCYQLYEFSTRGLRNAPARIESPPTFYVLPGIKNSWKSGLPVEKLAKLMFGQLFGKGKVGIKKLGVKQNKLCNFKDTNGQIKTVLKNSKKRCFEKAYCGFRGWFLFDFSGLSCSFF
jgi:hypothetical protein